jgi:hypothetical protein
MQSIAECIELPLLDVFMNLYMYEMSAFVRTLAWNVFKYQICTFLIPNL